MSPKLKASEGGLIGDNSNERTGVESSGGIGTSEKRKLDTGPSGRTDEVKLPPNQASMEALPGNGMIRDGAW